MPVHSPVFPFQSGRLFSPSALDKNAKCPAHNLTPEGLKCVNCGQCTVGEARIPLRKNWSTGYSSYRDRRLSNGWSKNTTRRLSIGVGCLTEVKEEGIDMADKIGLVAMGVVTLKEGCVETLVNWQDIYEVAVLGLDRYQFPMTFMLLPVNFPLFIFP